MKETMQKFALVGAICFAVLTGVPAPTVTLSKVQQRYPWNGKVDIDCKVTGTAEVMYELTVSVRDKVGGTNLTVNAVGVDGKSATGNPVLVTAGAYRLVWDADADLPNGFRSEKISISVTVSEPAKKFMIVDLGSGEITYQDSAPDGGWSEDPYKKSKMAFQRVEPGTFMQTLAGGLVRRTTISKPFYISVSAVTQDQLTAITGDPAAVSHAYSEADNTPLGGNQSIRTFREYFRSASWPSATHYVGSGPIWALRNKTGLSKFDMPTDAQAAKAFNDGVLKNVSVACLDWYTDDYCTDAPVCDPMGPSLGKYNSAGSPARVVRSVSGPGYGYMNSHRGIFYLCLYEAE